MNVSEPLIANEEMKKLAHYHPSVNKNPHRSYIIAQHNHNTYKVNARKWNNYRIQGGSSDTKVETKVNYCILLV